ncbi:MAG: hypothetical protein Q8935_00080 [Bacillota bacterium]|nr:hypothetical protein [Bacillota bacterium]
MKFESILSQCICFENKEKKSSRKYNTLFVIICLFLFVIPISGHKLTCSEYIKPKKISLNKNELELLNLFASFADTVGINACIHFVDSTKIVILMRPSDSIVTLIVPLNSTGRLDIKSFEDNLCDSLIWLGKRSDSLDAYGIKRVLWLDTMMIDSTMCIKINNISKLSLKLHKELGIHTIEFFKGKINLANRTKYFKYKPDNPSLKIYKHLIEIGEWYVCEMSERYLEKLKRKINKIEQKASYSL